MMADCLGCFVSRRATNNGEEPLFVDAKPQSHGNYKTDHLGNYLAVYNGM
jgi:hypothetical protein